MSDLNFYDLTYDGPVVQAILDTAQKLRTEGYIFMGAGTPSTVPGTPTERVWYLCGPGTYANFGSSVTVQSGSMMVAEYNGSAWVKSVVEVSGASIVDAPGFDLAISDENGNILVVFAGGQIITKKFNSGIVNTSRYMGKRCSILGDSISTYGVTDSRNQDGTYCYSYYPTETCRYSRLGDVTISGVTYHSIQFDVNDTWWMRLINELGMQLGINESWRGTRVSGSGTDAFNNQTRIDHLGLNGTPDLIFVYGGTNDAGGGVTVGTFNTEDPSNYTDAQIAALPVDTFADAYRAMLIRLMKTYPLAEIVCILPTFTVSYYTITNLDLYVEIIKEACDFFGIKYIDIRVTGINVYNKSSYLVDGTHPNAAGMALLSEKIKRQLMFT